MNLPFEGEILIINTWKQFEHNPKRICLINDKEEHSFKSIYACAKHFKINPGFFGMKKKCKNLMKSNEIVINDVRNT